MERRNFLQLLGSTFGAALAARPLAVMAASQDKQAVSLNHSEWATLNAVCEQIIPPFNGVGTRQVQCVNFIDKLLAHEEKATLPF